MTGDYIKPLPQPTRDTQPWWDALADGRLVIQRCSGCGKLRHYPRPVCDACFSLECDWVPASGHGTVHSWTVTHHPFHIGFKRELPYALATVELEEGVRLQVQLRDIAHDKIRIGLPVEVRIERVTDDLTLPYCVPALRQ